MDKLEQRLTRLETQNDLILKSLDGIEKTLGITARQNGIQNVSIGKQEERIVNLERRAEKSDKMFVALIGTILLSVWNAVWQIITGR